MSENEKILETLSDLANGLEAVAVKLKHAVAELAGGKPELDPSQLFWEQKHGEKGPFEQTSEKTNNNSEPWKALKANLKGHNGFWQYRGFKYWFDRQQENVIDRRQIG